LAIKAKSGSVLEIQELSKEEKDLQTRMSAEQAKANGNQEVANSIQTQFQQRLDQIKNLKKEAEQVLALTKPAEQKKLDNFRKDVEGANTLVAQLETKESDLNEKARLASAKGDDAESLVYGSLGNGRTGQASAGPLLGSGTRRSPGTVPGFAAARGGAAGSQTVRGNLGPLSAKAQAT
jgi:hypothetical protein